MGTGARKGLSVSIKINLKGKFFIDFLNSSALLNVTIPEREI